MSKLGRPTEFPQALTLLLKIVIKIVPRVTSNIPEMSAYLGPTAQPNFTVFVFLFVKGFPVKI